MHALHIIAVIMYIICKENPKGTLIDFRELRGVYSDPERCSRVFVRLKLGPFSSPRDDIPQKKFSVSGQIIRAHSRI